MWSPCLHILLNKIVFGFWTLALVGQQLLKHKMYFVARILRRRVEVFTHHVLHQAGHGFEVSGAHLTGVGHASLGEWLRGEKVRSGNSGVFC